MIPLMKILPLGAWFLALVTAMAAEPTAPAGPLPIAKCVAQEIGKASTAQVPAKCVGLLTDLPADQRLTYAAAILAQVAKTSPTAYASVVASLSKAYPELAPGVSLAAARSHLIPLPDLLRTVLTAAPDEMDRTLTAFSLVYPEKHAEIAAAAGKVFPEATETITATVAAAIGADAKSKVKAQRDDKVKVNGVAAGIQPYDYAQP